jgi:hypothetical protein
MPSNRALDAPPERESADPAAAIDLLIPQIPVHCGAALPVTSP